jgi:hypothetical protein
MTRFLKVAVRKQMLVEGSQPRRVSKFTQWWQRRTCARWWTNGCRVRRDVYACSAERHSKIMECKVETTGDLVADNTLLKPVAVSTQFEMVGALNRAQTQARGSREG